MATYCCDLGFDWNAATEGPGIRPLQYCLMNKDNNSSPAWFTQFSQGDVLYFVLYDITSLNGGQSVSKPSLNFIMTIIDPDTGSSMSPLSPLTYNWDNTSMTSLSNVASTPFKASLPAYAVGPINSSSTYGKYGQLYTFNSQGRFSLTVQVDVIITPPGGTLTTHTYIFDPEMIVGPKT